MAASCFCISHQEVRTKVEPVEEEQAAMEVSANDAGNCIYLML